VEREDGEVDVPAPSGAARKEEAKKNAEPVVTEKEKPKTGKEDEDGEADDGEVKEDGAESLEEGEVSDEGDPKPEKPPICRFYSRGACTWGSSCRYVV